MIEILTGPSASGKTTYAQERVKAGAFRVGTLGDAHYNANMGRDVIIDSEYLAPFDVVVKKFTRLTKDQLAIKQALDILGNPAEFNLLARAKAAAILEDAFRSFSV